MEKYNDKKAKINSTNNLIFESDLKKSITGIKINKNEESDILKKIRTLQSKNSFSMEILISLTENIYRKNSSSNNNDLKDEDSPAEDSDSNIVMDNGGVKVKNKTIKKMSKVLPKQKNEIKEEPKKKINLNTLFTNQTENNEFTFSSNFEYEKIFEKYVTNDMIQILDSLCYQYYQEISANNIDNFDNYAVNNLVIISYIEKIIPKEIKPPKLSEDQIEILRNFDRSKKTLFVDLDETLIHSDTLHQFENHDEIIDLEIDGMKVEFGLLIRPHAKEFLEFAAENYNLILFTAGHKIYAEAIIKKLDPSDKLFKLKFYRDQCIEFKNCFIKDLTILPTFGLKDMILVDNCIFSFIRNLQNGILISTYYNDKNDNELKNLIGFLANNIQECKDVRTVNENIFKFEHTKSFLYDQLISEGVIN